MRISDWSSDVCSSDLCLDQPRLTAARQHVAVQIPGHSGDQQDDDGDYRRKAADQPAAHGGRTTVQLLGRFKPRQLLVRIFITKPVAALVACHQLSRSEEHTSELQSLMRISYAVFCLTK